MFFLSLPFAIASNELPPNNPSSGFLGSYQVMGYQFTETERNNSPYGDRYQTTTRTEKYSDNLPDCLEIGQMGYDNSGRIFYESKSCRFIGETIQVSSNWDSDTFTCGEKDFDLPTSVGRNFQITACFPKTTKPDGGTYDVEYNFSSELYEIKFSPRFGYSYVLSLRHDGGQMYTFTKYRLNSVLFDYSVSASSAPWI